MIGAVLTFVIMVMTLIVPIVMITVTSASLKDADGEYNPLWLIFQALCIIPNIGFAYGITIICESEELGEAP